MIVFRGALLLAVALALVAPAAAAASSKPGAVTGAATNVDQASVTLTGRVDANEAPTTYFFQIGPTSLYAVATPVTAAGRRSRAIAVSAPVGSLAPATTYHYRLVAQNRHGITRGRDRTFKTRPQPLGVSLIAAPNPVAPGGAITLAGQLVGTGNAGRRVVLQANPFPYLQGFQNVGNPLVTDALGNFSFPVLSVPITTQYRVQMPAKPEVVSPVVVAGVAVQVTRRARKVRRHGRSVTVRFRGRITPARDGTRVNIQKLKAAGWVTIAHTRARDAGAGHSTYRTRIRTSGGDFRVEAESAGDFVSGQSAVKRITVRRR